MDFTFKNYLFNHHYLVSDGETGDAKEIFATLVALRESFAINITDGHMLAQKEMLRFVAAVLGDRVPEPFYRGFPESVRELTPNELVFDQCMHYLHTYGMGDFSETGHSMLENVTKRENFHENVEYDNFVIIDEEKAIKILSEYVEDLLKGTRPLNPEQYITVVRYISEYDYKIKNCASKDTAIRLLLSTEDAYYAKFIALSDVIKLVDIINHDYYGNKHLNKLRFRNEHRKIVTKVIDKIFSEEKSVDIFNCYEKKSTWCGLLHHIHYKPKTKTAEIFCEAMRTKGNSSAYAKFEDAMAKNNVKYATHVLKSRKGSGALLRNLNYIASRCKTSEEVNYLFSQISSGNNIILLQLLNKYMLENEANGRTFTFTKHNKLVVHKETPKEISARKSIISDDIKAKIIASIKDNLETNLDGKLGKVLIDPKMENIAFPLQENTSSGGFGCLPKGSRIKIPEGKKIRAFTYWEKVDDIDLSCIGISKNGRQTEFSWRTMYNEQNGAITFSGDETSGYDGGSEYFDINVELFKEQYPDVEYLIFSDNVYSCSTFDKCVCKAGYMVRDINGSGEIYEPKTVKSSFTIDAQSTFAYLFAIDMRTNDFVWLNTTRESRCAVAGSTEFDFLRKYLEAVKVINVYDIFDMLATSITYNPDKADVIISDNIEGDNVIHSYDFEKMISLINQ